ncbi:unnamed protein product [Rotaria sp. Silwood2]|nr:unnamed protein product [Rotaria sp. Silwood2]
MFIQSTSPPYMQRLQETYTSLHAKTSSRHHNDTLAYADHIHYLKEALHKVNAALECCHAVHNNLIEENDELRHFQSISGKSSPNVSAPLAYKTTITI